MELPQRIFLDTSVINFIVDYSEHIFDRAKINQNTSSRIFDDIQALMYIFQISNHNAIEMIISRTTLQEIQATTDSFKRDKLELYCNELWDYFHFLIDGDFRTPGIEVKYYEEFLMEKGLNTLIDPNDRKLVIEALFYKCDIFCTRDWKTILKHRLRLKNKIPLEIITPIEWCLRYEFKKAY